MKTAIAIATKGRASILSDLLIRLERQSRAADLLIISATHPDDLSGIEATRLGADVVRIFGSPGVAAQRNRALARAAQAEMDLVVFFDDDFVPFEDAIEGVANFFSAHETVAAATGHVVADGASGAPLDVDEAERLAATPRRAIEPRRVIGLYGCVMAIRMAAATDLTFDEGLPLYGWQEDLDFGARISARGDVVRTGAFGGAHLGVKSGRHPQRGLGYAQIANPARLMRRRAIPIRFLLKMMAANVLANATYAVIGDPWADRRGRLRGNMVAIGDLFRGRLNPQRARLL